MTDLLRVEQVNKHYGGVYALRNVDFSVAPGEVHALMGENGAGKSTLSKVIAGSVKPDSGRIFFDGREAPLANPLDAQRRGISIIYQELDLFRHLTVAENIVIGNLKIENRQVVNFAKMEAFCRPFLEQVGLDCPSNTPLDRLSIAQMQLAAIARALSLEAKLILMDEPTSSLADDSVETLFALIRTLRSRGVSIVYVSHKMDEIFRIADRITVLRDGCYIGTRPAAETNPGDLIRMMVGRDLAASTRTPNDGSGKVLLAVSGLTTRKLRDVSFELRSGEVLGVAGLVGAGRSSLGAVLFGLDPAVGGSIQVDGKPIVLRSPRDAIAAGIGLLPEDRKLQGLMMQMTVLENSTMAVLDRFQSFGFIRESPERKAAETVHGRLALKTPSYEAPVSTLSGGNQQKVLFAKWLLADPRILFLDDPTRGIDVGAKQDIYEMIHRLAADGKGVIFVSSELPELLRCSDRILVLNDGRVTGLFSAADATQEKIVAAAMNTQDQEVRL